MQTNDNIEKKEIVERWEWHDGWGKSCATKKTYRKMRRAKAKKIIEKIIKEEFNSSLNSEH